MSTVPGAYVTSSDTAECRDRPYAMSVQLNGVTNRARAVPEHPQ